MKRAPARWPKLDLPIQPPFPPMEAKASNTVPKGAYQYEPKWDGFRCLAFRDGDQVALQSKAGQPLTRYFPEIVEAVLAIAAPKFVLDGEIVIPLDGLFSFDDLLQRIHPAESRVRKLAKETPGVLLTFDLLVDPSGASLVEAPLEARRTALEALAPHFGERVRLSPITTDDSEASAWFADHGSNMDGVMAKKLGAPYRSGERDAMTKVKRVRSADVVIGGYRMSQDGAGLGSLLLGLYDDQGDLLHVGFSSAFTGDEAPRILEMIQPLVAAESFKGTVPGAPSRWDNERSTEWTPLKPVLVCEVKYDHFSQGRFRHGTKILRWRPDKAPRQCTVDQVQRRRAPGRKPPSQLGLF